MIHLNRAAAMQGFYKFEACKHNPDGTIKSRRLLTEWCENIVTNFGLNEKCGGPTGDANFSSLSAVVVGTGTSAPQPTDTQLSAFLAASSSLSASSGGQPGPPAYGWYRGVATFNVGVAAGNLTEVGAVVNNSSPTSTTPIISRSLIKDSNGNPIAITILPDESLQVTTEFRLYSPPWASAADDLVVQDTIDGILRTITIRPAAAGTQVWQPMRFGSALDIGSRIYFGNVTLGAAEQYPASDAGFANLAQGMQGGARTYINNSYQRGYYLRCPTGEAQNIGGFYFETGLGAYQVKIDPPVEKLLTEVFTFDLMISVGRPS